MEWILLVILAVVFASFTLFTDNYISDCYFKGSGAPSQKLFYALTQPLLGVVLVLIFGIDFTVVSVLSVLIFIATGFIASIASIFYYKTLEIDDSTNIGIFIQLAPVLYLVLGWAFLNETISPLQLVAFLVIMAGPLLIILATRKRSRKVKFKAMVFAFLYVLIAVIGNLLFVKENAVELKFGAEMGLMFIGKGLGNAVIMAASRKWRRRFWRVLKESRRRVLRPLATSFVLGVVKDFAYRGALVTAPSVALASVASDSAQPVVVFFMGLLLTIIWPKFGREKLKRRDVLVHLIATALVATGIVMMQA